MNKQGRILIVDDLPHWREQLVEILQNTGFVADAVLNGSQALERLRNSLYHVVILDVRLDDNDHGNTDGINLLSELDELGISEATKVLMLSAYGTKEQMRRAFAKHKVVDFLPKNGFTRQIFLENVQQVFAREVNINLELGIHWQQISGADQVVTGLEVGGVAVEPGTPLQNQMVEELEDLLRRLFYQAKSILVRPLTPGHSGTGVVRVKPFYTTGGGGYEVVVKFGEFNKVKQEYDNFKKYVQPFLGGGRNTMILDMRRTYHLGGIIYSLLGTINDQLTDFGDFYHHADLSQVKEALDRLFRDTCGVWYANRGQLDALDLTEDYQKLLGYRAEKLERTVSEELTSVQGTEELTFKSLGSKRSFTNPLRVTAGYSFVYSTYCCITHGDFNQCNLLVDSTGHVWMIDFQGTGQSHILRDVATLDATIRFQLLTAEEATLKERLKMEEALCKIERFSQLETLATLFTTKNTFLAKTYAAVVHLRMGARRLLELNIDDDMGQYYTALLYTAMNTIRFSSLQPVQREHALLCASLLADRLGLNTPGSSASHVKGNGSGRA
jgi:CheY-like chemotaxis protein